ncbi:hypothetical protein SLNWT_3900 [Streptomyces albus]|uniref:Uncharacterized protein n=1 Tax=Streptomyces albus (strain ATCC 21838 / DSM 41398 / FERM P-419 / JCM 4703 / NBRC 107858) TaxID=1081613 RepID=A0A0B5F085_STRA4|nr:hypothetical protein SLNWT_3900 [Streptomyces albus]AOU78584.1 hypothetical protein SLNHY_3893 [Streptomyces albus]AYN34325.1 hypothetical protein DUI70_3825 [Streptomyces albus]
MGGPVAVPRRSRTRALPRTRAVSVRGPFPYAGPSRTWALPVRGRFPYVDASRTRMLPIPYVDASGRRPFRTAAPSVRPGFGGPVAVPRVPVLLGGGTPQRVPHRSRRREARP